MAEQERHVVRGVLAGVAGGLVAAWVMNEFIVNAGPPLQHALLTDEENREQDAETAKAQAEGEPDATMKTADAIASAVTGGQHLTYEQEQKGGPVVHYTFGALMGGLYGGLAEYSSVARSGFGTTFGGVLFAVADLLAVPSLGLGKGPTEQPPGALAPPLAAHLVYGATTELVRRVVRLLV